MEKDEKAPDEGRGFFYAKGAYDLEMEMTDKKGQTSDGDEELGTWPSDDGFELESEASTHRSPSC